MPLINCPECKREISDKAELCPQCGFRLNESSKANTTTIQKTSKKLKARQAIGLIPCFASYFFSDQLNVMLWLWGIGLAWIFIVGIQIWWEHH